MGLHHSHLFCYVLFWVVCFFKRNEKRFFFFVKNSAKTWMICGLFYRTSLWNDHSFWMQFIFSQMACSCDEKEAFMDKFWKALGNDLQNENSASAADTSTKMNNFSATNSLATATWPWYLSNVQKHTQTIVHSSHFAMQKRSCTLANRFAKIHKKIER